MPVGGQDIESQIRFAEKRWAASTNQDARRKAWQELQRLHQLREPAKVEELERRQGLIP